MGNLLALLPQKNLGLAVVCAMIVVVVETLAQKFLGVNLAAEIADLVSTPGQPPVPVSEVLMAEASAVVYVIAHIGDIIDRKNKANAPQNNSGAANGG